MEGKGAGVPGDPAGANPVRVQLGKKARPFKNEGRRGGPCPKWTEQEPSQEGGVKLGQFHPPLAGD